jgi:hypothetical protein
MSESEFRSVMNVVTLVLGFLFLKSKGKTGYYFFLLIFWFTPVFWFILAFLKPETQNWKNTIISIVSFLIGIGSLFLLW